MEIKLPQMPFKFNSPDGPMEITVRSRSAPGAVEDSKSYAAAAAFISHGPRALEHIQVTPDAKTHREVMNTLVTGFAVNLEKHERDGLEYRVLEALVNAQGVVMLDN